MPIAQPFSGTATISTTEYSLTNKSTTIAAQTSVGIFQLYLDVSAMVAGDTYAIYRREKAIAGGTQVVGITTSITGVQANKLWVSDPLVLANGWDFTMKRTAGVDRSFSWSIRQIS